MGEFENVVIYKLAFRSEFIPDVTQDMLDKIGSRAQVYNQRRGITGTLLYNEKKILQFLEGGRAEITRLYHRIRPDPRHYNIKLIGVFLMRERSFTDSYLDIKLISKTSMLDTIDTLYGIQKLPGNHIIVAA